MTTTHQVKMPIRITLPEAFGTNTLHGIFYHMAAPPGAIRPVDEVMKEMLEHPILLQAGFRTPKEMRFIADEALKFHVWAEREFGVRPHLMFV